MSELFGRCSKCGGELTTGGCINCPITTYLVPTTMYPAAHVCCYHPSNSFYTTNPPQQIEACCHCGSQRSMGFVAPLTPTIPPGHGPYYPRNF